MDEHSPRASELGLCLEFNQSPLPRPKRLLDSAERVQALQSAKKACGLSHPCSTPDPGEKLLLSSPDSACFQGSSPFLDNTGEDDDLVASSVSKYDDVAISLDTTRCFDESEPDDSLLELSENEEGNFPFNYTEEEIQEILADDGAEAERHLGRRTQSQNGNGESEKDEISSCTGASVISDDTDITAEPPNEPLSREDSPPGAEGYPSPLRESPHLDENHLRSAQVTRMLFELDLQELLSLSPIDADYEYQLLEDSFLEAVTKEASEEVINDCLENEEAASSCLLQESSEELTANGQQSLGVDSLGIPVASGHKPDCCGDGVEGSVSSSDFLSGQSSAEKTLPAGVLRCPTPSSVFRNQELSEAPKRCFSGKLDSPEDEGRQEPSEAEQPSSSTLLSETAVGQIEQEKTTRAKKPGEVIPVLQEKERLHQGTCISEVDLKQKKHFYPENAHPCEESSGSCSRDSSSGELQSDSPQGHVSQPCLSPAHLGPFWQEQVRADPTQQGGTSSEDCP
ncbi:S100P-binding protein isoform X2 [Heliangelus exortis]|uniref:S100P-binding protein isoform X2 n=1 Tax=Heliangelus exortis TaxID=472823 RepID=UPI003A94471E